MSQMDSYSMNAILFAYDKAAVVVGGQHNAYETLRLATQCEQSLE